MNKVTIKASIDASNIAHVEALNIFLKSINGNTRKLYESQEAFEKRTATPVKEESVEEKPKATKTTTVKNPVKKTDKKEEAKIVIEDVRALLSKKVSKHRDAIKAKLTDLKAANVTSLDEKHYVEFMSFLKAL